MRLSSVLKISREISLEARREFVRRSKEIFMKRDKTNYEKDWLAGYMEHQEELMKIPVGLGMSRHPCQNSLVQASYSSSRIEATQEVEYDPTAIGQQPAGSREVSHFPRGPYLDEEVVRPADLNRLFVKSEAFDGIRPPPRQWLDQYEKAAISNGWSDAAKVKHMATFLKETVYSWLT